MKALSLHEPYASLITTRSKTIETRRWPTKHRGDLLICTSRLPKFPMSGMARCVVNVVDCRPMTVADEDAACCELYENAWAWVLENIRPIQPFAIKGNRRIFNADVELEQLVFV